MIEFLSHSFYNKHRWEISESERKEIDQMLLLEKEKGYTWREGFNPEIKPMRQMLEPLRTLPQPLFLFLIYKGIDICAHFLLSWLRDFKYETVNDLSFWKLSLGEGSENRQAIVFFHGIGVGLMQYYFFIHHLLEKKESTCLPIDIFLIDLPHISLTFSQNVPSMDEIVTGCKSVLECHDHQYAHFVGHSFGTCILTRMCQVYPETIQSATFLDPVCFLLYHSDVVYNFVYRAPNFKIFDILRYLFISRNVFLQNVLCRNFFWFQCNMWKEDLDNISAGNITIVLCEHDGISSTTKVKHWLEENSSADIHVLE
eukprot:Awhi_evm2s7137